MTDHVVELLPWYVNGTLKLQDINRVEDHVQGCVTCQRELTAQQRIHHAINIPNTVEIAPQPSFNKLWDRITADQAGEEVALDVSRERHGATNFNPLAHAAEWFRLHWMPITLAAQAGAIAVLVGVMILQPHDSDAVSQGSYQTVTSSTPATGTVIHVVFDDATRLGDIKDILLRSNLQVAAGPTATGVYSLSPVAKTTEFKAKDVIRSLHDDPRVRFAELSHE